MMLLVIVGASFAVTSRTTLGRGAGLAVALVPVVGIGSVTLGLAVVAFVVAMRHARRRARAEQDLRDAEIAAVEGLSLATAAGLAFGPAANRVVERFGPVGKAIDLNLRRSVVGLGPDSGQEIVDSMFETAQRSEATGAPIAPMLRGQLAELRRRRSEQRRKQMAKLPVKLLFPLAFLILPGFVLLTVVPTVVGGLSRLQL